MDNNDSFCDRRGGRSNKRRNQVLHGEDAALLPPAPPPPIVTPNEWFMGLVMANQRRFHVVRMYERRPGEPNDAPFIIFENRQARQ